MNAAVRTSSLSAGGRAGVAALVLALVACPAPCSVVASRADALDREPPASETEATEVRRWEYVVVVRTVSNEPDAVGRAEEAALRAGAAVLERVRTGLAVGTTDHRLLVRLRDKELLGPVLRAISSERGVLGATAVPLPETPTRPGGPSFMLSYTTEEGDDGAEPGIVVHHDVPPILDKRDLLETYAVPVGPGTGAPGAMAGGLTLNVSEMFKRLKESTWFRREQRMKQAYLPILPPATPEH